MSAREQSVEAWIFPSDYIEAEVTYGRLWWKRTVRWRLQILDIEDNRVRIGLPDLMWVDRSASGATAPA